MIERSIGYVSIAAAVLLLGLSGCASPGDDGSSAHYPPHAAGTSVAGSDLPPCSMIADPNARCIQDDHAAGRDARAYASASAGTAALPFALSAEDREAIGQIAYAEAGNQSEEGIAAVIFCVLNRVNSGLFQGSVQAVIDAPNQFEPATRVGGWRRLPPLDYSQSIQFDTILNLILAGRLPDLTNGALFFQNAEIVAARAARGSVSPYLVDFGGTPPVAEIGDHRFYDWRAAVNLASARDRRRTRRRPPPTRRPTRTPGTARMQGKARTPMTVRTPGTAPRTLSRRMLIRLRQPRKPGRAATMARPARQWMRSSRTQARSGLIPAAHRAGEHGRAGVAAVPTTLFPTRGTDQTDAGHRARVAPAMIRKPRCIYADPTGRSSATSRTCPAIFSTPDAAAEQ